MQSEGIVLVLVADISSPTVSSGAVRVLLQSGPGIHWRIFWLRQLQVGPCHGRINGWVSTYTYYKYKRVPEHTQMSCSNCILPISWMMKTDWLRNQRIGVTTRRNRKPTSTPGGQGSADGHKITEMPSWIFCKDVDNNPSPFSCFTSSPQTNKHVYILTVLHFITLFSDTVLSLAAFFKWHLYCILLVYTDI